MQGIRDVKTSLPKLLADVDSAAERNCCETRGARLGNLQLWLQLNFTSGERRGWGGVWEQENKRTSTKGFGSGSLPRDCTFSACWLTYCDMWIVRHAHRVIVTAVVCVTGHNARGY